MTKPKARRRLEDLRPKELAPLEAVLDPAYPDRLREVATCLYVELLDQTEVRAKLNVKWLAQLALALTERLSLDMGGSTFYMHKGTYYRQGLTLTPRNREMCAKFRGDYTVLAREYGLSDQQVRTIVDAWQRDQFLARQGVLAVD